MRPVEAAGSKVIEEIRDGQTIVMGAFSWRMGGPLQLLEQLVETAARSLRLVTLAIATDEDPLLRLIERGCVRELTLGFINGATRLHAVAARSDTKLSFVPYGTLIERVRAGACGIPAFYVPVGVGGLNADRPVLEIGGRPCLLEHAITSDVALVAAAEADGHRNLAYGRFYEHLNHYAALGARRCVAQVARKVPVLPAERIRTPGLVVTEVVETPSAVSAS